jgi:pilus assembly protein Flp/PilA
MLQHIIALQILVTQRLANEDKGATAVEYGLMVSLIAVVIIAAVTLLGTSLRTMFEGVAAAL